MKTWQWIALAVVAAAAAGVVWVRVRVAGDWGQPPSQVKADTPLAGYAPDGYQHLCQPHDHHAGYVYTPHRYPRTVGGEITTIMHKGYSPMRVPTGTPDAQWIVNPPSEVAW